MESFGKIARGRPQRLQTDPHLHSPAHMLADELSRKLNDTRHFGFYLKMATTHDQNVLRKILGEVLESKSVQDRGKLFAFLIKKHHQEVNSRPNESNRE